MGSGLEENVTTKWREFGPYWRHNYQANIMTGISGNADVVVLNRMGDRQYFSRGAEQADGRTAWTSHDGGRTDRLFSHSTSGGSATQWEFYAPDNTLDVFIDGRLVSRSTHDGRIQQLSGGDQVDTVTDSFGRQLHFERDSDGRLSAVALPDATRIAFSYLQPPDWSQSVPLAGAETYFNLVGVTHPDGNPRTYHYSEDGHFDSNYTIPSALTGITDENGSRYSDYYYSTNGIAIRSVIGNLATYSVSSWWYTDPLGTSRMTRNTEVNGEQRIAGAYQPGGSGCNSAYSSITYDTSGNVASRTDFAGHKTTYAYDLSRNLETSRVEGYGKAEARTISTQWHPDWRLESKRAEPKKLTTWVYNGQVDPVGGGTAACAPSDALLPDGQPIAVLCKKIEQATTDATGASGFSASVTGTARIWTWTYNQYGQVLTADGPRTDVTTYTYYADTTSDHTRGDLATVTDPLGHVSHYTRYDPNGRLLEMQDPNGLVTTLTYTARGWLKTRQAGAELTTYDYDAVGQLKKVTAADGSWIGYDYDDAHRLTDIYDQSGNRIAYTLDAAGNRTQEDVTDPDGNLARSQTRVYDALSRLQNVVQPQ